MKYRKREREREREREKVEERKEKKARPTRITKRDISELGSTAVYLFDVSARESGGKDREGWIQFNYGIDLFWSSKSFFSPALSATCRGEVRQKRASVACNERGTPFYFLFFFVAFSLFFSIASTRRWNPQRQEKCREQKNASARSTRVLPWNRLLTFLSRLSFLLLSEIYSWSSSLYARVKLWS